MQKENFVLLGIDFNDQNEIKKKKKKKEKRRRKKKNQPPGLTWNNR